MAVQVPNCRVKPCEALLHQLLFLCLQPEDHAVAAFPVPTFCSSIFHVLENGVLHDGLRLRCAQAIFLRRLITAAVIMCADLLCMHQVESGSEIARFVLEVSGRWDG